MHLVGYLYEEFSHLRVFPLCIILYCQADTVVGYRKTVRGSWQLKEEALDRTLWRTGFGIACVFVVRQITAANLNIRSTDPQWIDFRRSVNLDGKKNYNFIFTNL
jgi:hypothetical protein